MKSCRARSGSQGTPSNPCQYWSQPCGRSASSQFRGKNRPPTIGGLATPPCRCATSWACPVPRRLRCRRSGSRWEPTGACTPAEQQRPVDHLPSHAVRVWDPLAVREFSALVRDPVFRGRGVPPGDGRPVRLVPGFLAGDWTLRIMEGWLRRIGYRTYLSGILLNVQHSERLLSGLRRKVAEIEKENDARVSMVGHSRGGLLAKVLSQRKPQLVEQVITLGAPVADWTDLAALTHHAVGVVRT